MSETGGIAFFGAWFCSEQQQQWTTARAFGQLLRKFSKEPLLEPRRQEGVSLFPHTGRFAGSGGHCRLPAQGTKSVGGLHAWCLTRWLSSNLSETMLTKRVACPKKVDVLSVLQIRNPNSICTPLLIGKIIFKVIHRSLDDLFNLLQVGFCKHKIYCWWGRADERFWVLDLVPSVGCSRCSRGGNSPPL